MEGTRDVCLIDKQQIYAQYICNGCVPGIERVCTNWEWGCEGCLAGAKRRRDGCVSNAWRLGTYLQPACKDTLQGVLEVSAWSLVGRTRIFTGR